MVNPACELPPGRVAFTGERGAVYIDGRRLYLFHRFVCRDRLTNRSGIRGALDGIARGLTLRDADERGRGQYVRVGLRSFAWRAG